MKWMKERDLLIAQTMAFVQSVTGKTPETAKTVDASIALFAIETSEVTRPEVSRPEVTRPAPLALPDIAPPWVETPPAAAQAPAVMQAPVIEEPAVEVPVETPRPLPSPAPFSRLDLREDFQSEIKARVANFRAHQERFSREREAYCAATMAKVHATLKEGALPPPRTGK